MGDVHCRMPSNRKMLAGILLHGRLSECMLQDAITGVSFILIDSELQGLKIPGLRVCNLGFFDASDLRWPVRL